MHRNSVLRDEAVNPIWQEDGGRLVIDIASVPLKGVHTKDSSFKGVWDEWVAETAVDGLVGAGCYRWDGPDLTWNPGAGLLAYRIHIQTAGDYTVCLRNRHQEGLGDSCFVRVDGGQWSIVRGGGTGAWNWITERETSLRDREPFRQTLAQGFHQIEISGRLNGFCIERLALALDGIDLETSALPASRRRPR